MRYLIIVVIVVAVLFFVFPRGENENLLVGTKWELVEYRSEDQGFQISETPKENGGAPYTLKFISDTEIEGRLRCNTYRTFYNISVDLVTIETPVVMTKVKCPESVYDYSDDVVSGFERATSISRGEDDLVISMPDESDDMLADGMEMRFKLME